MADRTPSYRLHKPSGRAVVTLGRRDYYLGEHGSPESRRAYDRLLAEWLANGRRPPSDDALTVATLARRYMEHVEGEYRSNAPEFIEAALRPLIALYADVPAAEFGPKALVIVRDKILARGHVRAGVNKRVHAIVRMFRWGVSQQLTPASVWEALRAVESIRKGKPGTREGKKVQPVDDADVDATIPRVSRQVAAMIQVQRLTGMRPGEVCAMRTGDVDMADVVWVYTPSHHKTEHLDHERRIFIGPAAQDVLRPFLRTEPEEYLFQPREAEAERMAALRAARKSKVQPSQVDRRKVDRVAKLSDHYGHASYRRAVERGVARENERRKAVAAAAGLDVDKIKLVPVWTPNQLRHAAATRIRRELGLEAAQVVLGHSSLLTTQVYAKKAEDQAREAMGRLG